MTGEEGTWRLKSSYGSTLKLTQLELSARDEDGNTAADYLAKGALTNQNEMKVPAAFRALVESFCSHGPRESQLARPSIVDLEAQRDPGCRPPGAYPIYNDERESSIDEVHRETVATFSCHYKSPYCDIFDARRGVCSGVIKADDNRITPVYSCEMAMQERSFSPGVQAHVMYFLYRQHRQVLSRADV